MDYTDRIPDWDEEDPSVFAYWFFEPDYVLANFASWSDAVAEQGE